MASLAFGLDRPQLVNLHSSVLEDPNFCCPHAAKRHHEPEPQAPQSACRPMAYHVEIRRQKCSTRRDVHNPKSLGSWSNRCFLDYWTRYSGLYRHRDVVFTRFFNLLLPPPSPLFFSCNAQTHTNMVVFLYRKLATSSLSVGQKVGIGLGVPAAVGFIIFPLFFFLIRKKRQRPTDRRHFEVQDRGEADIMEGLTMR